MKPLVIFLVLAALAWGCDEAKDAMTCEECEAEYDECRAECDDDAGGWVDCWEDNCVPSFCDCLAYVDCQDKLSTATSWNGVTPLCQDY